jgi:glycosyltransferase involved in cell wall biosynthesis
MKLNLNPGRISGRNSVNENDSLILDVSVIICCYNSQKRIVETLRHLAQQESGGLDVEIILVDNNCSDDTVSFAVDLWARLKPGFPLHVIRENMPGLSNARKAGIYQAKGEILVFCDDDNWLAEDYINVAFKTMMEHTDVGACCGQNFPFPASGTPLPVWFSDFSELYACGRYLTHSGDVTTRKAIWGAGMVIRRTLIIGMYKNGMVHIMTDRKGSNLSSGGDTEICYWLTFLGWKLWFEEKLKLNHFIEFDRLTVAYRDSLKMALWSSTSILNGFYDPIRKSLRPLRKMDFVNIFRIDEIGKTSRLKLGLGLFTDPSFRNSLVLRKMIRHGMFSSNGQVF